MDYKKKYENAVEKLKKFFINDDDRILYKHDIETVFPELKESEDDKIKKAAIEFVKQNKSFTYCKGISKDDCLAWLEKQGEQKVNEIHPIFRVGDYIRNKKTSYKVLIEQLDMATKAYCYVSYDGAAEIHSDFPFSKQDEWELIGQKVVEQNHTDKVESKFKVGDWVVQENIGVYKIIEICKSWYEVIDFKDHHYSISFNNEYMCHLWTIQDAKDDDVLAVDYIIFIYKTTLASHVVSYCRLIGEKFDHFEYARTCNEGNAYTHPATKEQRDLLFQKMKEAGYEWDSEKKELKKIEQTSTEDNCKIQDCDIKVDMIEYNKGFECGKQRVLKYPEDYGLCEKSASTWSEEDEEIVSMLVSRCNGTSYTSDNLIKMKSWLKSLKERMKGE